MRRRDRSKFESYIIQSYTEQQALARLVEKIWVDTCRAEERGEVGEVDDAVILWLSDDSLNRGFPGVS